MGERRLARLNDEFDVRLEGRFLEIHPETPPEGMPVSGLGYPPAQWARMMENLERMGKADGIVFSDRTFTTNSHKALLLAEAAKEEGPEVFEALNEGLFRKACEERLARDREAAAVHGISAIPAFVVSGRWILEGAVPVEMLREVAKKTFDGAPGGKG